MDQRDFLEARADRLAAEIRGLRAALRGKLRELAATRADLYRLIRRPVAPPAALILADADR
jgi:hypothetical protein